MEAEEGWENKWRRLVEELWRMVGGQAKDR